MAAARAPPGTSRNAKPGGSARAGLASTTESVNRAASDARGVRDGMEPGSPGWMLLKAPGDGDRWSCGHRRPSVTRQYRASAPGAAGWKLLALPASAGRPCALAAPELRPPALRCTAGGLRLRRCLSIHRLTPRRFLSLRPAAGRGIARRVAPHHAAALADRATSRVRWHCRPGRVPAPPRAEPRAGVATRSRDRAAATDRLEASSCARACPPHGLSVAAIALEPGDRAHAGHTARAPHFGRDEPGRRPAAFPLLPV